MPNKQQISWKVRERNKKGEKKLLLSLGNLWTLLICVAPSPSHGIVYIAKSMRWMHTWRTMNGGKFSFEGYRPLTSRTGDTSEMKGTCVGYDVA